MKRQIGVIMALMLLLTVAATRAAQASILSQAVATVIETAIQVDAGPAWWIPVTGDERWTVKPTINLACKVIEAEGPACPTNKDEIWPWAKANLRIEFPFTISDTEFLDACGAGISERAQIGTIRKAPIVVGLGCLTREGPSLFTSVDVTTWLEHGD